MQKLMVRESPFPCIDSWTKEFSLEKAVLHRGCSSTIYTVSWRTLFQMFSPVEALIESKKPFHHAISKTAAG